MIESGRVLVVDDSCCEREILRDLLRDHFEVEVAENGAQALAKTRVFEPDLILLDIMMPGMDGYEVCRYIKSSPVGSFTQVVLVSSKCTTADRLEGYDSLADDYIAKPFNHDELLSKVKIQFRLREANLRAWSLNRQLQDTNANLEKIVQERMAEILATRDVAVFALAQLADSRDLETGEHLIRIRAFCQLLAEQLSNVGPYASLVDQVFLDNLYQASPLHDIGKVGIPDAILLKPGRHTKDEMELMKKHVEIGAQTLERGVGQGKGGEFLQMAAEVARYHHERFEKGYCAGLKGEEIPLSARIVSVADVYDALSSRRIYKRAYSHIETMNLITAESGKQFDPVIVEAFVDCADEFSGICAHLCGNDIENTQDTELTIAGIF